MWDDFVPLQEEVREIKERRQVQSQAKKQENPILVVQNTPEDLKSSEAQDELSPLSQASNLLTPQSEKCELKVLAPKPPLFPKKLPGKIPLFLPQPPAQPPVLPMKEPRLGESKDSKDIEEQIQEKEPRFEIKRPEEELQKKVEIEREEVKEEVKEERPPPQQDQKKERKVLNKSSKLLAHLENLKVWIQKEMQKPGNKKNIALILGKVNQIFNKFSANPQSLRNAVESTLQFLYQQRSNQFIKVIFLLSTAKRIKEEVEKWASNANIKEMILFFCLYSAQITGEVAHFSMLLAALTLKQCPLLVPQPFSRELFKTKKEYETALGNQDNQELLNFIPKLEIRSLLFIMLEVFQQKYQNVYQRLEWMVSGEKHEFQPVVLEGLVKTATPDLIKYKGLQEVKELYRNLKESLKEWRELIQAKIKDEADIVLPYLDRLNHWLDQFLKKN